MTILLFRKKLFLSVILAFGIADAFVLKPSSRSSVIGRPMVAKYGDSDYEDCLSRNKVRTDLRNFLTQRSIQSFTFLLSQVRDEYTVRWMEQTLEFGKIDRFHGTGLFNTTLFPSWDSLFLALVMRPKEAVVVTVQGRQRRHRGLASRNHYLENIGKKDVQEEEARTNPYLEEKTIEFEFDIDPASLVTRMISVREEISKEWVYDLETLIRKNDQLLECYLDHQFENCSLQEDDEDDQEVKDLTAPYSDRYEEKAFVYDRNSMTLSTNSFGQDRDSTPYRRSNFDLLLLLSTQESIHRVLREYRKEDDTENYEWLRDFYNERVKKHFDGHQSYGRADDFLEELLLSPPKVHKTGNGEIHFIDPMGMAEDILQERSEVAREWKSVVAEIPEEHTDLRRLILTRRMMDVTEEALADSSAETIGGLSEAGSFE